jgi:flavin reductase (DIM6/NTAB) family NADH-FMN oxidoreductase RutF
MKPMRSVAAADLARQEAYRLLTGVIVPRPIALVATQMTNGKTNIAPFSFFNGVASKPPSLSISVGPGERGEKDTVVNLRRNPHFVVNVVTESLLPMVKVGEQPLPRDVSEAETAGVALAKSSLIEVPRLAEAEIAMECRLIDMMSFGPENERTHLCIGEILAFVVADRFFDKDARLSVDAMALAAIGRIDRGGFVRYGERFHVS